MRWEDAGSAGSKQKTDHSVKRVGLDEKREGLSDDHLLSL